MKASKYYEEDKVDVAGYTLVVPSVSVGNVGQLAVDLLLHNLPCRYVGAFSHPSVRAVVGCLPDGVTGKMRLITAVEVFVCESKKLLIIQIRSPISSIGRLSLMADLVSWSAERGVARVVQLASCHAAGRPDPAAPWLYRLVSAGDDVPALDGLAPPLPPQSPPSDDRQRPRLSGAGFVPDLHQACEAGGLPYTCLLRHTYEGNNIPEAVELCNCLDSWLGLLDEERCRAGPPSEFGRWKRPPTWSHLFGGHLDPRMY